MLPRILNEAAKGFVTLLGVLTPGKMASLFALGPALFSASAGIAAVSTALAGARILGVLQAQPTLQPSIQTTSATTKTDDTLSDFVVSKLEQDTSQNEVANKTNQEILSTLKEMLGAVKQGGKVTLDGNKLTESMALSSYKT